MALEINDDNFDEIVGKSEVPVVLDFGLPGAVL